MSSGDLAALPFFRVGNYVEAGFWVVVAVGFLVGAMKGAEEARLDCLVAFVTFLLFGWSDVVEVRTGAWYRPLWLLAWKAACLGVIAWLLVRYVRRRRGARDGGQPSEPGPR